MKRKIRLNRIIDLIFWFIIAIITLIELYNGGLNNINITEINNINFKDVTVGQYISFVLGILFVILFTTVVSMIKVFYLTVIYFGTKIAIKRYSKDRLDKVDLKNDSYYRDLLPKYSLSVLSYIDDFKIDKKDIVATLLMLELKRKVKIQDKDIIVIDDKTEGLEDDEAYVLNKLKNKTLKDINILELTSIVKSVAIKKGLIEEKQDIKKNIKTKIIINVIAYISVILGFFMLPNILNIIATNNNALMLLGFILLIILFGLLVFMPYSIVVYISHYKLLNTLDPYIRNNEGKMINVKLEGLRKYLIDFSRIEEKTKEELILWEEYLVYSVILGINTKVVEEVYGKI